MINNKLILADKVELENVEKDKIRIIVDGKRIQTKEDFLNIMEKEFAFPNSCNGNGDAFLDYIRDLSWLDYRKIEVIIMNKRELARGCEKLKNTIIHWFEDLILPFWQEEVVDVMVEGERREFMVYVVDEII